MSEVSRNTQIDSDIEAHDRKISIILGNALKENKLLTSLELYNFTDADLWQLIRMCVYVYRAQSSKIYTTAFFPMYEHFYKEAILQDQLRVENKILINRQMALLEGIIRQLEQEQERRQNTRSSL